MAHLIMCSFLSDSFARCIVPFLARAVYRWQRDCVPMTILPALGQIRGSVGDDAWNHYR